MPGKLLVVVTGPTASGKTAFAIEVARHFQTEIVSADSRQFYKEIPIGTAQPDAEQLAAVPHHFIGAFPLEETISAGSYAEMCRKKLDELFQKHDVVVLTGGSGLYIDVLLYGVDRIPEVDPSVREELNRKYEIEGIEGLQSTLLELDPNYYARVDIRNHRRLIRALEVCIASGQPYSDFLGKQSAPIPYSYIMAGMLWPRDELYARINQRVDAMLAAGLQKEAEAVYSKRHFNSLHTVGFAELFAWIEHKYGLPEAIELIKKNTRNYAKRQMTWLRKHNDMRWFSADDSIAVIRWAEAELKK